MALDKGTTDKDTGWKDLVKGLKVLDDHHLKVGVVVKNSENLGVDAFSDMWDDEKKPNSKVTIAQAAAKHHPRRPWLTLGIDKHMVQIDTHMARTVDEMLRGKLKGREVLMRIGKRIRAFQRVILETEQVMPISEARIAEKRAIGNPRNALINWGRMLKATSFRIDKGD